MLDFSIITPSLNMSEYLKRAVASVKDQDVLYEHIIIDGGSTDGTIEYLENENNIKLFTGKDNGMYDAINKGFINAKGKYIGQLNCDEQYLPGILKMVKQFFETYPDIDIIYGNKINIYPDGTFNSFKKSFNLRKNYIIASSLYIYTSSLFYRRKILDEGNMFNPEYKSVGDVDYILRLINKNYKFKHVNSFFSVFTITGNNLSRNEISKTERKKIIKKYYHKPLFLLFFINILRILEKTFEGAYFISLPHSYFIYTDNLNVRTEFKINNKRFIPDWN